MHRGNEEWRDVTPMLCFLGLLGEMSERFGVEVHAYVLMGNHYHLILRTPNANASRAMQWLNVSFSAWSNAKRQRVGHVFQGRFRSTLIDGEGAWLLTASAYLHLNPVRVSSLGLGKTASKAVRDELLEKVLAYNCCRTILIRQRRQNAFEWAA